MRLVNLVFPPKCIFCHNVLPNSSDINICRGCFDKIPFIKMNAESYSTVFKTPYCDKVICPCRYEGIIKKALTDFKFKDRPSLYRALAFIIGEKLTEFVEPGDIDIISAVPLSRKRFRLRGYNQAELLASFIARELNSVNASSVIIRTKNTKKQASLNKEERKLNVCNAFTVIDSSYVVNKKVLIVDDIFTTGSTISECAMAFKDAGAAEVYAAVVASGRYF